MRGERPIGWPFDWLGNQSQGTPYELFESVQPVINVDGLEFPFRPKTFSSTGALAAGTVNVVIANNTLPTAQPRATIVLQMEIARTNAAAGDSDSMILTYNNGLGPAAGFRKYQSAQGALIPANIPFPVIGGMLRIVLPAGTLTTFEGRKPIYVPSDGSLVYQITAAAAVGNYTIVWYSIDVPVNAPLPGGFLL